MSAKDVLAKLRDGETVPDNIEACIAIAFEVVPFAAEAAFLKYAELCKGVDADKKELTGASYIPFGDEWKREVMKLKKSDIIDMLAKALMAEAERDRYEKRNEALT